MKIVKRTLTGLIGLVALLAVVGAIAGGGASTTTPAPAAATSRAQALHKGMTIAESLRALHADPARAQPGPGDCLRVAEPADVVTLCYTNARVSRLRSWKVARQ